MKFRLAYIFVLCIFCKICTAQSYFNNRYDLFTKADATANVFCKDSSYFVSCGGLDITQSNLSLSLLKLNKFGITTASKHYFKTNNWFYTGLGNSTCQLNDSVLISTGYRVGSGTSKSFIHWYKNNLDSIKYLEYGFVNKENVIYSILNDNIKYLYQIGYVDSSYTNSDILLIKTDTSGNEIWKKKIGLVGWDEYGSCIKQCANGNLLISGLKDLRGSPQQGPFMMRLDTSGAILWQNYYPSATYANGSFDAMEMPNGDIVFTGGSAYAGTGPNGYTLRRPMLIRVDASGNLIWQKEYGAIAEGHDFFTFLINGKGHFVVSGCKAYSSNSFVGMVYEINQNGDSLFSREYTIQPGSQNYFRDVVQAPDKGYCFSGFISPLFANGGTGTQDIWLLKTDSTFCESAVSCGYPTGVRDISYELGEVSVYPNPAQNEVTFKFENEVTSQATIILIDVLGKMIGEHILQINSNNVAKLNVSALPNGLYYYTIKQPSRTNITGKLTVLK